MLRDTGMHFFLVQLYGAPGESMDGGRDSLELSYRLKPSMIVTQFGLRIQPDTLLREIALEQGVISENDDGFEARFYLSPETSAEDLRACVKKFRRSHPWQIARFVSFVGRSMVDSIFGRA